MNRKRILVTGGAGFIGSHVVGALTARHHHVVVVDDLSGGRRENLSREVDFHRLDIRDESVGDLVADLRPDVLFHLAAQLDVRRSVADPCDDADINVLGSIRLLEHCRRVGCRRVIFSSTGGAIYGEQDRFPADESHLERPLSPYGIAKLAVEKYLRFYSLTHAFRTTSLRYANVYGPRQSHTGEAGVVAIFFHRVLSGEAPTIFGDGEQTRDYVYVGDVVNANLAALDKDLLGAYNVGTGIETSVNDLFAVVRRVAGSDLPAAYADGKAGEQRRSSLDATKLRAAGDWRASTTLEEGLARTCEYFRQTGV